MKNEVNEVKKKTTKRKHSHIITKKEKITKEENKK